MCIFKHTTMTIKMEKKDLTLYLIQWGWTQIHFINFSWLEWKEDVHKTSAL
jgi:hypothetical protein